MIKERIPISGDLKSNHLDNLVSVNPMLEAEVTVFDKTICEIDALEQAGYVRYIHEPVSYTHLDVYKRQ